MAELPRREVVGAWTMLLGYVLLIFGLAWDAQWHIDVGPDTFFTAPHLLLYSGPAIYGLSCLAVVLLNTWGRPEPSDRPAVAVLRVFRAPVTFLVGGIGAALFMLYGAADLWWHEVYGFDIAQGDTPSHVGLQCAFLATSAGLVMAFAALRGTRSGRWGFAISCVFGLIGALPLATSTPPLPGVSSVGIGIGAVCALFLGIIAGTTRGVGWLLACAAAFVAVQGLIYLFAPWATRTYADAIGLSLRDYASQQSAIASAMPITFPVVLAISAGVIWFARRTGARPGVVLAILGGATMVLTMLLFMLLAPEGGLVPNLLVGALVGSALTWLGWHASALLRRLAPRDVPGMVPGEAPGEVTA
ncbi:hypothetical protein [Flindersiella endophytica]